MVASQNCQEKKTEKPKTNNCPTNLKIPIIDRPNRFEERYGIKYCVVTKDLEEWPVYPNEGISILEGVDDGEVEIDLSNDGVSNFTIGGISYNKLSVHSNGYIGFGEDFNYYYQSSNYLINFLNADLIIDGDGSVKYQYITEKKQNDVFVLTFFKVPELGTEISNNVQVKLWLDNSPEAGKIEICFGSVDINFVTVGLNDRLGSNKDVDFSSITTPQKFLNPTEYFGNIFPFSEEKLKIKFRPSSAFDLQNKRIIFVPQQISGGTLGKKGDKKGDILADSEYLYICTKNFDGMSRIWKRTFLVDW